VFNKISGIVKLFKILSLDIVLGACVGTLFIANYLQIKLPLTGLFVLALTVWLIYTFDHLLDAQKISHQAHTARHLFHQKHFFKLILCWVIVFVINFLMTFTLPLTTIIWGVILIGIVVVYFIITNVFKKSYAFLKEPMAALIYTSGVFLGPISVYKEILSNEVYVLFCQYTLVAMINLMVFSTFDKNIDDIDGHPSLIKFLGRGHSTKLIWSFGIIFMLITISGLYFYHDYKPFVIMQSILILMTLTLLFILVRKSFFEENERYRLFGDAVFLYPIIII